MRLSRHDVWAALLIAATLILPVRAAEEPVSYLYNLSNFSGTVPYNDVTLYADRQHDEVYAAVGNFVRVFNAAGMEVYQFLFDPAYGRLFDLAVDESGDILVLSLERTLPDPTTRTFLTWCDYRGEPLEQFPITGLPPAFESFIPNRMLYREGRVVLVSLAGMQVVVVEQDGVFREGHDLTRFVDGGEDGRRSYEMFGFDMDRTGRMAFTVPALFKVFVVEPDGQVNVFGRPGSIAGSFGVVAGIGTDEYGRLLVADKQREVVLVFDESYQFVAEFGAGRDRWGSLVRPNALAIGSAGKVYVTQKRNRGVAVYKLSPGDVMIRSDAGPQSEGGVDRGRYTSNEPDASGTENSSLPGSNNEFPAIPLSSGSLAPSDPADPGVARAPESQGGDRQ